MYSSGDQSRCSQDADADRAADDDGEAEADAEHALENGGGQVFTFSMAESAMLKVKT